jgi:hypothetical protein
MDKKFKLGQFYTTRAQYIIGNLISAIPKDCIVVEPFCGMGDLLIAENTFELYDIDPKIKGCERRDTLINPPNYHNKFVITNPPFLARNKNDDKTIYDLYNVNDLYKASIKSILDCEGGILIVPLNFFCDDDDSFRNIFFQRFKVTKLNVFEETVFDDTAYTICSFLFQKNVIGDSIESYQIPCNFFPSGELMNFNIERDSGYRIGSEFFKLLNLHAFKSSSISRLKEGDEANSSIFLRAIDTGAADGKICLKIENEPFFGKKHDRSFATITFNTKYSLEDQKIICEGFNQILEEYRKKYRSMFLTSFMNSSSGYSRKRIGFDDAYKLINYVMAEKGLIIQNIKKAKKALY